MFTTGYPLHFVRVLLKLGDLHADVILQLLASLSAGAAAARDS